MTARFGAGVVAWLWLGVVGPSGLLAVDPPEKAKHLSIRSTKLLSSPYASEKGLGADFRTYGAKLEVVEEVEGEPVARSIDINDEFIGLARKLPPGLALGEDPYLVPLKGKVGIGKHVLQADRIDPPGRDKKSSAELAMTYWSRRPGAPTVHLRATVRAGDVLLLGDDGYRVRNVVPRDDKTKAIGWVELAPDPIPKADLVRDKVKVVEPVLAEAKDGRQADK